MALILVGPYQRKQKTSQIAKPYKKPDIVEIKIVKEDGTMLCSNETAFNSFSFSYFNSEIHSEFIDSLHFIKVCTVCENYNYTNTISKYTLDSFDIYGNILKLNDTQPINPSHITSNDKIYITLTDSGIKKLTNCIKSLKRFNSQSE